MIISRTPHRISFFGGGTDYPEWYIKNGGKVLGVAIDKYCYITIRYLPPFFAHKYRIAYSKVETVVCLDEIQHPSVRETLKYLNLNKGLEIHHDGDIPALSGMGSSSAFTVGLLKSLNALKGNIIAKKDLYTQAIHIEQNIVKENVGSQDQVWAARGGFNKIEFLKSGEIFIEPIIMKKSNLDKFENNLMLFYTGISRYASKIAEEQIAKINQNKCVLFKMMDMVDEAYNFLTSAKNDFSYFGNLLNEAWRLKKSLANNISNSEIDDIYKTALKYGALGGKLLGAGGGGFMLFYVEKENQSRLKKALNNYLHVPFSFDYSGSKIIVYEKSYL